MMAVSENAPILRKTSTKSMEYKYADSAIAIPVCFWAHFLTEIQKQQ